MDIRSPLIFSSSCSFALDLPPLEIDNDPEPGKKINLLVKANGGYLIAGEVNERTRL